MKRREMLQTTLGVGALALCPSLLLAKGNGLPVARFNEYKNSILNGDEIFGEWKSGPSCRLYDYKRDADGNRIMIHRDGYLTYDHTCEVIGHYNRRYRTGWAWVNPEDACTEVDGNFNIVRKYGLLKFRENCGESVVRGEAKPWTTIVLVEDFSKGQKA